MEQNASQHGDVPQIVASAKVVKHAWAPPFGDLAGVDQGADNVDGYAFSDGRVKLPDKVAAAGQGELHDGKKAGRAEPDEEGHARPGHFGAVEGWVPREDDAADAENGREDHVDPAAHGLAVKGGVLGGHDGGGNQQRDARVVDAGKSGDEMDVGDGVHGVPDGAADQALAGGEEEHGGDEDVGGRAQMEVDARGVKVKGHGEHQDKAQGVRPNIDELVGDGKGRPDAVRCGLAEAIPLANVRVHPPRDGQVVVADQAMLLGAEHGALDRLLECLGSVLRAAEALLHDTAGLVQALVQDLAALAHHELGSVGHVLQAARAELVGAGLDAREHVVQQLDAHTGLVTHVVGRGEGVVVP